MQRKIRKIQIYSSIYELHAFYKSLFSNPPEGYKFEEFLSPTRRGYLRIFKKFSILKFVYKIFLKLFKIDISSKIIGKEESEKTNLIFSTGVIYPGSNPWVLEILDSPYCLTGYNYQSFIKNKDKVEKKLLSKNCKKIIVVNETSLELMKKYFCQKIIEKTELIRASIQKQNFNKSKKEKLQILFMGSITNPNDFEMKGGLYVLEVFKRLSKKYNLNFVIKCRIPSWIKRKYCFKNLKIIESKIPYSEIQNLYINSDIFLLPGRVYVLMAVLEAMSFGLPIICLDTYAVRDYIINNQNGIIVKKSKNVLYNDESYPCNVRDRKFAQIERKLDKTVIKDLYHATVKLIEDKKLREKLSKKAKQIAETKFSLKVRNQKLKKIFDDALN